MANFKLFIRIVRMLTEAETQLVSVERIMQYMNVETEAPAVILETLPPRTWPDKGAINFRNLKLRYRCERKHLTKL